MIIFLKSWDEYRNQTKIWIMGNGTAVQERSLIKDYDLALGRWHRSKDKKIHIFSDFSSYMINKKWWLEDQFNVHMMRFQQVKFIDLMIRFDIFSSRLVW